MAPVASAASPQAGRAVRVRPVQPWQAPAGLVGLGRCPLAALRGRNASRPVSRGDFGCELAE